MSKKKNNQSIGLAEMIHCLRLELEQARNTADKENSAIRFEVEKVDVELQVTAEKVKEGNGKLGVKFWVVNADAGGKAIGKNSSTQTVKLTMNVTDAQKTGDQDSSDERKLRVRG